MRIVRETYEILKNEKELLEKNKKEIEINNRKLIAVLESLKIIFLSVLIVISYILNLNRSFRVICIGCLILSVGLAFLNNKEKFKVSPKIIMAMGYAITLLYCIAMAKEVGARYIAATMWGIIFLVPIIIMDRTYKVVIATGTVSIIFIGLLAIEQNYEMVGNIFINISIFTVIAIIFGSYFKAMQLVNYELRRKGAIRETTDELTGLFNRRKLRDIFKDIDNKDNIAAVAMIDIDNFKKYNDTYGHQLGDKCLREIGETLIEFGKKNKITFFRYGGEEFLAIIENNLNISVEDVCKLLNEEIYALKIYNKHSDIGYITISIGVEKNKSINSSKYINLVLNADKALYEAKRQGKNRTVIYDGKASM